MVSNSEVTPSSHEVAMEHTLKRTHNIKKKIKKIKRKRKRSFEWIFDELFKKIEIEIQWYNSEDLNI
jgi:hypothetical protein